MKASTGFPVGESVCRMCGSCDREVTTFYDYETMTDIHYETTCCDSACGCLYKPNVIIHQYTPQCCDECMKGPNE